MSETGWARRLRLLGYNLEGAALVSAFYALGLFRPDWLTFAAFVVAAVAAHVVAAVAAHVASEIVGSKQ